MATPQLSNLCTKTPPIFFPLSIGYFTPSLLLHFPMAKFVAFILLALLAISMVQTTVLASHGHGGHHKKPYGPGSLTSSQCPSQCSRRCSQTQYHKPCMFFCQKCCTKCLCVPPGYYGNKAVCPCYNNWKTKEGGPKCP